MSLSDILYLDSLLVLIEVIFRIFDYKSHKNLFTILDTNNNPNIYKLKTNCYTNLFIKILDNQNKIFLEKEDSYRMKINELQEYTTQWVHDVKVNISICDLLLESEEFDTKNILYTQIEKIKFNINQILYVTRATHYNQDVSCEEVNVCTELRNAIKENAFFFINKNISIETTLNPFTTVNDKKWINYIFSQILNNCSKYTPENGSIIISSDENDTSYCINIKDNGPGIPKEDLPRIFDKGFTGKNGRSGTKSTGMGLFYAKNMANLLHIGLKVKSEEGLYTNFSIIFFKLSDYYDVLSD
ncbi:MAG: sensor histidine kinase [Clostridium perfringens]|nr:sensor histidine kinase [Clostridium perfringens]